MKDIGRERVRRVFTLLILLAFAAPACAEPITIAIVPSVPAASTLIADEKGYFRDAGLDVKIERIDSIGKAVAFLAANRVQVAQGASMRASSTRSRKACRSCGRSTAARPHSITASWCGVPSRTRSGPSPTSRGAVSA